MLGTASSLPQLDVEDAFVGEDPEMIAFRFPQDRPVAVQLGIVATAREADGVHGWVTCPKVDGGVTGIVLGGASEEYNALRGWMGDGGHKVSGTPSPVRKQLRPSIVGEVQTPEVVKFVVLTRVALPSEACIELASGGVPHSSVNIPMAAVRRRERVG